MSQVNLGPVEKIWKENVREYSQDGLEVRLKRRWPESRNVHELISYQYPPTFQPGYIGQRFKTSRQKILILSQNPGEGSDPISIEWNRGYSKKLIEFGENRISFGYLNEEIAREMVRWKIFAGKGIFLEAGHSRGSLLPAPVRLSIHEISYLNYFPFKTIDNLPPVRDTFSIHVWNTFVKPLISNLKPRLLIRFPATDRWSPELETLVFDFKSVRVWHPSDRNFNSRRSELINSWTPVASFLNPKGTLGNNLSREPRKKIRAARLKTAGRRSPMRMSVPSKGLTLEDARGIAESLIKKLCIGGHSCDLRVSKTRVRITVEGVSKQVIGVVPKKRTEISCPWFSEEMVPSQARFREWRGYQIIDLPDASPADVENLCVKGLKGGGLL